MDNLKAHLVKIHKVNKREAAWHIQGVEGKGRSWPLLRKAARRGNGS